MKKLVISFLGLLLPYAAFADPTEQAIKDEMKADLDVIQSVMNVNYAPYEWKKQFANWNLQTEISKAKERIQSFNQPTVKDFQRIVRDFFNTTRDYHVGVRFYSTESASLPFTVKGINDHYYISYIDESRLSSFLYQINIGDELVLFDGRPTHEVVLELQKNEFGTTASGTDRAFAELALTSRLASRGFAVPNGPITIKVQSLFQESASAYQLIWEYQPEKISNHYYCGNDYDDAHKPLSKRKFFHKYLLSNDYDPLTVNSNPHQLGARHTPIPVLGRKWWQTDRLNPFHAYIFENDDKRLVGYIRIPHYMGSDEAVEAFGDIIEVMQERTDALIIDQINNPGGGVFYLYSLCSMLTDQPLVTPKHRVTITQEDVMFSLMLIPLLEEVQDDEDAVDLFGETFGTMRVTFQTTQFLLSYLRHIIKEWDQGHFLTSPTHLYGIDHINPHPYIRYTKPILLLINELDISGGDFFPAILQDNKRATLMGTQTAGAGGYVLVTQFPNRNGIAFFRCTGSIAERIDKQPIENLGVSPEIPYHVTENDLQLNYCDYKLAIKEAIQGLLAK